jgi:hypothetical protein
VSRFRSWAGGSTIRIGLLVMIGAFLVIQLVPYGHDHGNPPVTKAVAFDSPKTQQLFDGACGDCHSNLTSWPIESSIAPASWLIQHDVEGGRSRFNASEWDHHQPDIGEVTDRISSGEMPPLQYKILHPDARLSDPEKAALVSGLTKTYKQDPPIAGVSEGEGD